MLFGLRNTAQTFQHFMDRLFNLPYVFCYLDNLIIASHTLEKNQEHLQKIFTILQENFLPGITCTLQPSPMHSERTPRRWYGCPSQPSRQPRPPWRLRYRWCILPPTLCSPWQRTPPTHT
jgi:hypothetical protein